MSTNPLEHDPEREHRIRDRAYHLWIEQDRPHGRHDEFWERASELIGMEESAGSGQLPNPLTTGADPNQKQPVEEAFLQENLGDFPDRRADQSEGPSTPRAGHAHTAVMAEKVSAQPSTAKTAPGTGPGTGPETAPGKPSLKKAVEQQASRSPAETTKKRTSKH